MSDVFWLSDEQWSRLALLLPNDTRGVPRMDDRRVISGIVHVLKSGGRWVDAPAVYGPRKTLYNRFVRWAAKGVWQDLFVTLAAAGGPSAAVLLDSSLVKARRRAAGGKGRRGVAQRHRGAPLARALKAPIKTVSICRFCNYTLWAGWAVWSPGGPPGLWHVEGGET